MKHALIEQWTATMEDKLFETSFFPHFSKLKDAS